MRKMLLFNILCALLLTGCILFKKNIQKPVVIYYDENEITASLSSSAWFPKYLEALNSNEVVAHFLDNFRTEAARTKNVTITTDPRSANFILKFRYLQLTETSKTEKINDAKSQYNGQEIVLNSVECCAAFEIQEVKYPGKVFLSCTNSKSRSEKFTNTRDLGDLITGSNKDRSQYKTKLLREGIAIQLTEDVGRRIWVPITRRIAKTLK